MTPEQLRDHLYGKWDVRDTIRRRAIREDEDKAVEEACAKYRRHTVDIRQPDVCATCGGRRLVVNMEPWRPAISECPACSSPPAPRYVEDEMLVLERGWRRVKLAWWVLGVLVAVVVAWKLTSIILKLI
jgi:hypothetical protein